MLFYFFFFFKQKTAYEMRISDWSSDVCSSDLVKILKPLALPQGRLGLLKLGDLSGPACQAVRAALLTVYSRTYAGKIFQSFRSALAQSVESGLLAADPAAGMRIVTASRFGADERVEIPRSEEHTSELQSLMRISY